MMTLKKLIEFKGTEAEYVEQNLANYMAMLEYAKSLGLEIPEDSGMRKATDILHEYYDNNGLGYMKLITDYSQKASPESVARLRKAYEINSQIQVPNSAK